MIELSSKRLTFTPFVESDAPALAELLSDSSITRNITANGSTPEQCLVSARKRIDWHNSSWEQYGYGVWALRAHNSSLAAENRLLGWCGFTPPDGDDPDPEILYAIAADFRGIGLASEAASRAISWLFDTTGYQGVSAVISSPLNPGSVNVVTKLGMAYRDRMEFSLFLSSSDLADEVIAYEIWRLARDPADNWQQLVEQVAFRAGQLSTVTSLTAGRILRLLADSLSRRCESGVADSEQDRLQAAIPDRFEQGRGDPYMDCYHLTRDRWNE